mgnify:CR=1 FL=1
MCLFPCRVCLWVFLLFCGKYSTYNLQRLETRPMFILSLCVLILPQIKKKIVPDCCNVRCSLCFPSVFNLDEEEEPPMVTPPFPSTGKAVSVLWLGTNDKTCLKLIPCTYRCMRRSSGQMHHVADWSMYSTYH